MHRRLALAVVLALLLAGCTGGGDDGRPRSAGPAGSPVEGAAAGQPPRSTNVVDVVATTSVVADLVRLVGSTNVRTHTVVKAGLDPLTYRLTTLDHEQVAAADVVLGVGRGLEPWLDVLRGPKPALLSDGLPERATAAGVADPFVWLDADNGKAMLRRVAGVLTAAAPQDGAAFAAAADAAAQAVDRADAEARRLLAPRAGRAFVTTKDTMGWFAARYGLVHAGSVIPSASGAAEVTPQHLSALKEAMRARGVKAVFGEVSIAAGPAVALARETGTIALTGADALCGDGLGTAGSGSDTYVACLVHNARELAAHV